MSLMSDAEYQSALARITEAETEIEGLTVRIRECIDRARELNNLSRESTGRRTSLQVALDILKAKVRAHQNDVAARAKQEANERAAAEAAAKRQAEAEAVAAAEESGVEADNRAMSTVVEYQKLIRIQDV